jgi:hypothetical protein
MRTRIKTVYGACTLCMLVGGVLGVFYYVVFESEGVFGGVGIGDIDVAIGRII